MSLKEIAVKETDGHLRLVKKVISALPNGKNLIISPLSIHLLLALTTSGSSGPTRAQLLSYLNSESLEQLNSLFSEISSTVLRDGTLLGGPLLSTKSGIWVDQTLTLKPAFRAIAENSYKAVAENVDFKNQAEEARTQVNAWCDKETKGLIKEILPEGAIDSDTVIVLANAVYFKGAWDQVFDAARTTDRDFFLLNGSPISTSFITNWEQQIFRAFEGFKVVKLPYKRGGDTRSFSMYIYLPDARDGLPDLMERVCSEAGFIDSHLPYKFETLAAFRIPKFKIAFQFEASEILKGLGVVLPFVASVGLDQMVDSEFGENVFVRAVRHKAFVEVNEEGTEAAAVTEEDDDLGYGLFGDEEEKPRLEFVADHPFLFVIREDTSGVLLFVGQLLNPLLDTKFEDEI